MNRHHMALFVRNCRLILLLRKNFNEGDLNIFSPAEWRWKLPQVCDNEWHQYAVSVDLSGRVDLYIDGGRFEANSGAGANGDRHTNPEVIDDWPLHAAHGVNTTLTIGACYQGAESRMKHGFNGDIAVLRVAMRRPLTAAQIRCGTECSEHLVAPPERYLEPAQQVQANAALSDISIEGSNKTNIQLLLQRIAYVNTKPQPTIGRRNIELRATVSCPNVKAIRLPTVETYIMVTSSATPSAAAGSAVEQTSAAQPQLSAASSSATIPVSLPTKTNFNAVLHDNKPVSTDGERPQIIIDGTVNQLVTYPNIKQGVDILGNLTIRITNGGHIHENLQRLDACSVTVFPSLNPDHEQISGVVPQPDGGQQFDVKTTIGKDGVELVGYDTVAAYLRVLRALVYTNKKPAYYLNRVFKLTCNQAEHFRSSEYTMTLTVLHPKQQQLAAAAASAEQHGTSSSCEICYYLERSFLHRTSN